MFQVYVSESIASERRKDYRQEAKVYRSAKQAKVRSPQIHIPVLSSSLKRIKGLRRSPLAQAGAQGRSIFGRTRLWLVTTLFFNT
jgi:hypothetical protein